MGDAAETLGDMFSANRSESQARRAANRSSSLEIIRRNNIKHSVHNGGAHIVVEAEACVADLWPGTGKWITRSSPSVSGRGVFDLLRHLGVKGAE